jgi:hypothetical protein
MSGEDESILDILGSVQRRNELFCPVYIAVVNIPHFDLKFFRLFIMKDLLLRRWIAFYLNYLEVAKTNVEINDFITHWVILL